VAAVATTEMHFLLPQMFETGNMLNDRGGDSAAAFSSSPRKAVAAAATTTTPAWR